MYKNNPNINISMSNKIFLLNIFGLITDLKFIKTKIETSTAVKSGIKGPVIRVNGNNNIRW